MQKRVQWIDLSRGVAIIAMVVGHTLGPYTGQFFGSFIFAFHMPIFFILSGYLYHLRAPKAEFKRGAINLLLPYATTSGLILILNQLARLLPPNPVLTVYFPSIRAGLLAVLYGAGSPVFNPWHWQIQPIGAIWFLLSLFIAMQLFNGVTYWTQRFQGAGYWQAAAILGLTVLGARLAQIAYFPWALNAALFAQIFLYVGMLIRRFRLLDRLADPWYWLCGALWLLSAFKGYFVLTIPASPNWLLSVLGAIGGSLCVIRGCLWLQRFAQSWPTRGLVRMGRLSLIVMCFHLIDLNVIGLEGLIYTHVVTLTGPLLATVAGISYRLGFTIIWLVLIPKLPLLRCCYLPRQFLIKRSVAH